MANPTDNLPGFALQPGFLPSTIAAVPQVQPVPRLAPQVPVQPQTVVPPSGFVPRGPTPYGVPGIAAPVVAPTVAAPAAVTPATAAAPTAPAAPVAMPAATTPLPADSSVSPTPGQGNPFPASMQGNAATAGDVGLPAGRVAPTLQRAAIPSFGGVANQSPAAGGDDGIEVIRGGMVSGGSPGAAPVGGSGQVGSFRDPAGTISAGFDRQQAYAQNFMDQALNYIQGGGSIFERATRGRAIAGILHAVAGQNNEGSAQASGVNGLNSSIAGLSGASLGAQAQEYGADTNAGNVADTNANRLALGTMDAQGRTVQTGQTMSLDPATGLQTVLSNFAQPQVGQGGRVTLKPIAPPVRQAAAPKPIVGAQYRDKNGNMAVYQADGTYKAVTQ